MKWETLIYELWDGGSQQGCGAEGHNVIVIVIVYIYIVYSLQFYYIYPGMPKSANRCSYSGPCFYNILQAYNKAVLEPRVSPAFAITYFCNHCNIRFENTSKYVDTLTLFSKNLNQRSLTPRWPLTPCLLRSHVWLYPRIIVSKSHDNKSMYVDTVINFAKYHIHTYTYYVHTTYILHTYYVQNEWSHSLLLNSVQARQLLNSVQARQKWYRFK